MKRSGIIILLAIITLFINSCSLNNNALENSQANFKLTNPVENYKYLMVSYINGIRTRGTKCAPATTPLTLHPALEQAAIAHAKDLAHMNRLTHDGSGTFFDYARVISNGKSRPLTRIKYFGYPMKTNNLIGEVVSYATINKDKNNTNIFPYFEKALNNLIEDPTHCEILMNPRFKNIGLSMEKNQEKYFLVIDLAQ